MLTKKRKILILISISVVVVGIFTCYFLWKKNLEKRMLANIEEKSQYAENIDIAEKLRTYSVTKIKEQLTIPSYSTNEIHKMNLSKPSGLTAADLKLITKEKLVGLEEAFIKAEKDYGVNPLFLIAIASLESADGTICFRPNNMFGFGSRSYSSREACIDDVAKSIKKNYLTPGGSFYYGTTISDVNRKYATSTTWDTKIGSRMKTYYSTISKKRNEILKKL